jgi:hypothetical protein
MQRFFIVAFGFVLFSWSTYTLASVGLFSRPITMSLASVFGIAMVPLLYRWLASESRTARIAFTLAVVFSMLLLADTTPSIFSGRDQGAIAEAAIELSRQGHFIFSSPSTETFSAIYGPGKALNFPGFFFTDNGSLQSQFPGSYTAWVGIFYSLFGLSGLILGNGTLLILSLLTLFMVVRNFANESAASGALLMAATSFVPTWFAKFTLTENLGLFLFLFLSLSVILFLRAPQRIYFFSSIITATLLAVTRVEGLPILAIVGLFLFASKPAKSFEFSQTVITQLATFIGVAIVLILDFLGNIPRYTTLAKAVLHTISDSTATPINGLATSGPNIGATIAFWKLFLPYGLLLPILLGLAGIVILLIKKNRLAIVPAILALPTFLYLLDPNISSDHPWMLRRLMFSIWPALLITFSVALSSLFSTKAAFGKKVVLAIMTLVVVAGIAPTLSVFRFSENQKLLDETRRLAEAIGPQDLLLIDRDATGDPYALPSGPLRFLFDKNAVYAFNPDDFAKIPKDRYHHIYLLVPNNAVERWGSISATFSFISTFSFETKRLGPLTLNEPAFPDKTSITTDSLLFLLDPL